MSENAIDDAELIAEIFARARISEINNVWRDLWEGSAVEPEFFERKSVKALKSMKKETTACQEEGDQCAICLELLTKNVELPEDFTVQPQLKLEPEEYKKSIVLMPCKHRFHLFCLTMWLDKHSSCPNCRAKVKTDSELETEEREQILRELHDSMFN